LLMNDEALEQIQTKIAFLERAAADLSDVVFRQHTQIQTIEAKLNALARRLGDAQLDENPRPTEEERPPHY
jgi:uncharacterized coiled-coil protein SlyX